MCRKWYIYQTDLHDKRRGYIMDFFGFHNEILEEIKANPFMVVCSGEHKIHMIQSESI